MLGSFTLEKKSVSVRGKSPIIIGMNDEKKGYRVYLTKDRILVVTQHVKNAETLTGVQDRKTLEDLHDVNVQEETKGDHVERPATSRAAIWTCDQHVT